jgi:hypothetical protein
MVQNEIDAQSLATLLTKAGIAARVRGKDTSWGVEMGSKRGRALLVHCLRYQAVTSLTWRLSHLRRPYEGPEYRVMLEENDRQIVDGRTRSADDVVACAAAWLSQAAVDEVMRDRPFLDEGPRTMRTLAERLGARFHLDRAEDPGFEFLVYGHGRRCKLHHDRAIACGFFLGQAPVAYGVELRDLFGAVEAWLSEATTLGELTTRFPDVELERYAEVVETDPARWHWLHLRDHVADPNTPLAPMRKLIEALAVSPIASTFFTYSSVGHLCFSSSSHYPYVNTGLPIVSLIESDSYDIRLGESHIRYPTCDLNRAVQVIETVLAKSSLRPFLRR